MSYLEYLALYVIAVLVLAVTFVVLIRERRDALTARDTACEANRKLSIKLSAAEIARSAIENELGRCYKVALEKTGAVSVEPFDEWLARYIDGVNAESAWVERHHRLHHERDDAARKLVAAVQARQPFSMLEMRAIDVVAKLKESSD